MKQVGRYLLEERIGEGAMALVYRGHDPEIGRAIALKLLKPELRGNEEIVARFLRESRAAGALSHAGIATIHDVGEVDNIPYIAMELLQGEPLDAALAREGKFAPDRVASLGAQLAEALAYAHRAGVVHRDIKPSNIFLVDDGRTAKLLDFGIARLSETDRIRSELQLLRTQVGQVVGTPRYMSPEQALGLPLDGRSDLFSLGAVLYELLTGTPAFNGESLATVALQVTQQDPRSIAKLTADCPKGLAFVIERLLAKSPERRFADGEKVAAALRYEAEDQKRESGRKRRSLALQARHPILLFLATAVTLAVTIFLVLGRQEQTLERMTVTAGTSIAAFVGDNAALRVVENAGLPPEAQDWAPLEAFVRTASREANIVSLKVLDAGGVVRGSDNPKLIGRLYRPTGSERAIVTADGVTVTEATGSVRGFRFVRPIRYAGRPFGRVDLVIGRSDLDAALADTRGLLAILAGVTLLVVLGVGYASARLIATPIRRLRRAFARASGGDLDFRISHNRRDEFGLLFDGFNAMTSAFSERLEHGGELPVPEAPQSLDETRIDLTATAIARLRKAS